MGRVNYYLKHLVVKADGGFSETIEWITDNNDPKIVCHPVMAMVGDLIWGRVANRQFLMGKLWFLLTLTPVLRQCGRTWPFARFCVQLRAKTRGQETSPLQLVGPANTNGGKTLSP